MKALYKFNSPGYWHWIQMLFVCLLAFFFLLVLSLYWTPWSMWSWMLCRLEDKVLVSFCCMLIAKFLSTLCWTMCLFFSEQFFSLCRKPGSYSHTDVYVVPSFYSIGLQVCYVPVSYCFYCYGDMIISSVKFLLFRIMLTTLGLHSVTAKKWISNTSIHLEYMTLYTSI